MVITDKKLRQVIREEITRSLFLEQDAVVTPDTDATDTPAATKEKAFRHSPDEIRTILSMKRTIRKLNTSDSMIMLLAQILSGTKILSSNTPNNVDGNLLINSILNIFALENLDDKDILFELQTSLSSAYPENFVKAVQKKLGIQVDGDFGRQTLVSVLTNGQIKMVPAHMRKKNNPNMFKLLSKSILLALLTITPVGMGFYTILNDAKQVVPSQILQHV